MIKLKIITMNKLIHLFFANPPREKAKQVNLFFLIMFVLALLIILFVSSSPLQAQNIGINTTGAIPDASALLDIDAAPGNDKGLLIPRVALTQTTSNAPIGAGIATSLLVYNTATVNDVTPGYYYWSGTTWIRFATGSAGWLLLGNAGTIDGTNFIGTTDNIPFNIKVNNEKAGRITSNGIVLLGYQAGNSNTNTTNTGIGYQSLFTNTSGQRNVGIGFQSLYSSNGSYNTAIGYFAMRSNTSGEDNVGIGKRALWSNTTGFKNTAVGSWSLPKNTTGQFNTALGYNALNNVVNGNNNTAVGYQSLNNNTVSSNSALGFQAGFSNTTGIIVGIGYQALYANTTGNMNTAVGFESLLSNTTDGANTAVGYQALRANTSGGSENTAIGSRALWNNTNGSYNTAVGSITLFMNTGGSNTAIGYRAMQENTTGGSNVAIGNWAFTNNTTGNDNVVIGKSTLQNGTHNQCTYIGASSALSVSRTNVTAIGFNITNAQCTGNNQVLLGNTAVTQIRAQVTGITAYSDARYKTNIKENVKGLDFIKSLTPVTYNVKPTKLHDIWGTPDSSVQQIDHSEIESVRYMGFLAQDVEKAMKKIGFEFTGIDIPKNDGEVYSLRYTDFIMPIVKAIQEQQEMIEKQQVLTENQQILIEQLRKEILKK